MLSTGVAAVTGAMLDTGYRGGPSFLANESSLRNPSRPPTPVQRDAGSGGQELCPWTRVAVERWV